MHPEYDFLFLADKSDSGKRLDIVISQHLPDYSRSFIAILIRKGNILVQGKEKKPGYKVCEGDEIRGSIQPSENIRFDPEPIPLDILYEDDVIIVVNKQPGLVVHPAPGHYTGTLLNGILYHCPEIKAYGDQIRAGIVHRLDKDTSGTMVIAKTKGAHEFLSRQFKDRTINKKYIALVHGVMGPDSGQITFPIGRHPIDRKKMSILSSKGRDAKTLWRVTERFLDSTLLEIELKTGRTHQIRAHCAAINHPVVGDPVYGGKKNRTNPSDLFKFTKRQMLHSWCLGLVHPERKKDMIFEAPIPADMEALISSLRSSCS
jgi:23S rRNA pseudouridine1911/1915/1917 synthase